MANVSLSEQDVIDIAKVAATEADKRDTPQAYQEQVRAVTDVIMNRVASPSYPDTVRGVINQDRQFSKIAGPAKQNPYGNIQKTPAAPKDVFDAVKSHVTSRAKGASSTIGTSLSYGNITASDKVNREGWLGNMKEDFTIGSPGMRHSFGSLGWQESPGNFSISYGNPNLNTPASTLGTPTDRIDGVLGITGRPGDYITTPSFAANPTRGIPTPTARPDPVDVMRENSPFSSTRDYNAQPSGILSTPSMTGQQRGMFSDLSAARAAPQTGILSAPMSAAQNMGTPANENGFPSPNRMSGVAGITRGPEAGVLEAPMDVPDFSPIPAGVLDAYQQHARSRTSGLMPDVAAPAMAPKQPTFAEKALGVAKKAAPAAILGMVHPALGVLATVAQKTGILDKVDVKGILSGPSDISASNALGSGALADIARGVISNPSMHTTPGGFTNYSGPSANYGGMHAVTNASGITTISDDNHSFIDNSAMFSKGADSNGGDSPGTVLCTYYHSIGWIPDDVYVSDLKYAKTVPPDIVRSYHRWAVPLTKLIKTYPALKRVFYWPVRAWAESMHRPEKWWSKALRWTGETICKLTAPKKEPAHG